MCLPDLQSQKKSRTDFRFAPSQLETALLCNDVSHWLGANLESALEKTNRFVCFLKWIQHMVLNSVHHDHLMNSTSVACNVCPPHAFRQVFYGGYHGDLSETYLVGRQAGDAALLVCVTEECRDAAIAECGPGVPLHVIGTAIQWVGPLLYITG